MPGFSADIELVRPAFSPGDTPAADVANVGVPGTFTAGTLIQFEDSPLVPGQTGATSEPTLKPLLAMRSAIFNNSESLASGFVCGRKRK